MQLHTLLLCFALASMGCGGPGTPAAPSAAPSASPPAVDAGRSNATNPKNHDAAAFGDAHRATHTAPPATDGRSTASARRLSSAECAAFVDHAITLSLDAHNKKTAPELRPTPDQLIAIRSQLRGELAGACVKLPRPGYRCAMAAKTTAEFVKCGEKTPPEAVTPK